ncbi:MAG: diaminopimelate decarboxylase [Armatimonadota bacterium]|nr:diaminopimelate decarboxylase [Armatimonadota bacterium]
MLVGTQKINDQNHLVIGGCDALDLVTQFGSPLYVMDEDTVRQHCRLFKRAFAKAWPGSEVTYAGKAFLPMAMCRIVDEEGLGLDVASGGELHTALKAQFPPSRILLHGNNKSVEELRMAVDAGVGRIVVDNLMELEVLRTLASPEKPVSILIRVTPGIDPHTHRRIRTGQADTKFGLGIPDGQAMLAIQTALKMENVKLLGLHCHAGSQLLDMSAHTAAAEIMVDFMADVRAATRWTPEDLNLGGGFGIRYLPEHTPPTPDEAATAIAAALQRKLDEKDIPYPRLLVEPGRAIVAEAGVTLYTVGAIKQVSIPEAPFQRLYVSVDGGMSDNPRPQLYDARYHSLIANRAGDAPDQVATIAGKHCETDILIWDMPLAGPKQGDVLAVLCTGAYNQAMSSNYNRLPRPALVFVKDGKAELVIRRETLDDLLSTEVMPKGLSA